MRLILHPFPALSVLLSGPWSWTFFDFGTSRKILVRSMLGNATLTVDSKVLQCWWLCKAKIYNIYADVNVDSFDHMMKLFELLHVHAGFIHITYIWPPLAASCVSLEISWWQIYACTQTVSQIPDTVISGKLGIQIAWCCPGNIFPGGCTISVADGQGKCLLFLFPHSHFLRDTFKRNSLLASL